MEHQSFVQQDPAAVTIPRDIDLFLSLEALPTTANIIPIPVPAIPKPITNSKIDGLVDL